MRLGDGTKVHPLSSRGADYNTVGHVFVNELVFCQPGSAENHLGTKFRADLKCVTSVLISATTSRSSRKSLTQGEAAAIGVYG